tara:strand:- start:1051 stop:1824 length:774 start_codon:yes stop_codon:yes gene_type:complete
MFGTYFYNKNIRNIVILFGTVFNDISIRRTDASNVVQEEIKVPIAYGPAEKFLVRLREATDISKGKVGLTLPRMSFEFTAINYDSTRKLTTTKQFKAVHASDSAKLKRVYTPVPYNFDFTLSVMVRNSDDGTQILEQILPYFTPAYQVTMNEMSTVGIKRDIPIVFTGLSTEDTYEGDFLTRRALIHTLTFTVHAFMYGPVDDIGIIKEVDVYKYDQTNQADLAAADRVKASSTDIKPDPTTADADDDYGYTTTYTE